MVKITNRSLYYTARRISSGAFALNYIDMSADLDLPADLPEDLDTNSKQIVSAAYKSFKETYDEDKKLTLRDEDIEIFTEVAYENLHNIYIEKIDQLLTTNDWDATHPYNKFVRSILKDLKNSKEYKSNVECMIQLENFIVHFYSATSAAELDLNTDEYKTLFLRYRAQLNEFNYEHIQTDTEFDIRFVSVLITVTATDNFDSQVFECLNPTPPSSLTFNSFVYFQDQNKDCIELYYINSSGKYECIAGKAMGDKSAVDLNDSNILKKVKQAVEEKDLNSMRNLLGENFPRDRNFELAKKMHEKSRSGPTTLQYAGAQLGAIASVPGSIGRYMGRSSNSIKATRSQARRKQIKEDYSSQKWHTNITLDRRVEELRAARSMLNSGMVESGIVSTRPCRIRWANVDRTTVTAESHENKIFEAYQDNCDKDDKYKGDFFLVTTKGEEFRIAFIDHSGQTPIKRELKFANQLAQPDLLYILGASPEYLLRYQKWSPSSQAKRLKTKYENAANPDAGNYKQVNRELFSFLTLHTGYVPENQASDDLVEKYEFNQQCNDLEVLIQKQVEFRQELIDKLDLANIILLDKNEYPNSPDSSKRYLYVHGGLPITATLYDDAATKNTSNLADILTHESIGINCLYQDCPCEEISQAMYDRYLQWLIDAKKGQPPFSLEVGKMYYVAPPGDAKNKIWSLDNKEIIIDIHPGCSKDSDINARISRNASILKTSGFRGLRYTEGTLYYDDEYFKTRGLPPFIDSATGEPPAYQITKRYVTPQMLAKSKEVLAILRKIEDLPASFITTSESIVPYDKRRELVEMLSEYIKNPNTIESREYFRDSYHIQASALPSKEYREPFTFYYDASKKTISYVNADGSALTSEVDYIKNSPLNYFSKDPIQSLIDKGGKISSADVYENITKNLVKDTAFKMHTANEAILEVVDEEIVSYKQILTSLAYAVIFIGGALLLQFVPIGGQLASVPFIGMAAYYLGIVAQIVQPIAAAYKLSQAMFGATKSSYFSSRHELMNLKEQLAELTKGNDDMQKDSDEHARAISRGPGT